MTVPKSERNETSAEYIIHAENMRQDVLSLTRRMPKRWDKDVIQDMRDMTR